MPKKINEQALFEATVQVFAERGYVSATTREIAERAGVNEVTIFRRHGSKADLIRSALDHCLSRSAFSRIEASGDVKADLVAIVQAYGETVRAYGGAVVTLLSDMARHPDLRGADAILMQNMRKVAQIIAIHQRHGLIGPGSSRYKAVYLIAPLMALGIWERSGSPVSVRAFDPESVVNAFLRGHGRI
jgi:AcrR family transcriptional regulator